MNRLTEPMTHSLSDAASPSGAASPSDAASPSGAAGPSDAAGLSDAASVAGADAPHESARLHVAGEATYVDDIPELAGTLHVALGLSTKAHAMFASIDLSAVRASPDVIDVLVAAAVAIIEDTWKRATCAGQQCQARRSRLRTVSTSSSRVAALVSKVLQVELH